MRIKANKYEILTGLNNTKLLLEVDKESVGDLRNWHNENTLSGDFSVEIKKWYEKRSLNANAYFHLLVNKMASVLQVGNEEMKNRMVLEYGTVATNEDGMIVGFKVMKGVPITSFIKYIKELEEIVENKKVFIKYIVYKNTSTLNAREMARLIEGVIHECKELGIETITPNEKAKMLALWKAEGV